MNVDEQFLDGAAEAAGIILDRMLGAMTSERGVHVESLFTALGSHAGHVSRLAAADSTSDPEQTLATFWGLVARKLQQLTGETPDASEYVAHSGPPRYEEGTAADDTPEGYLISFDVLRATFEKSAPDPQQWPVAYGIAVQSALDLTGGQFDYGVLARIVMDSAVATSTIRA